MSRTSHTAHLHVEFGAILVDVQVVLAQAMEQPPAAPRVRITTICCSLCVACGRICSVV